MKYINIFHANLNYAYLTPDRYEFVIRNSYELTLDTLREQFPEVKFVFEASGYTVEQIALRTPDVLEKLNAAIANGTCEFMGSPHAHPMLPNFPEADGVKALEFAMEAYERHLGFRPVSFWNPECGWRSYVPRQIAAAGYKYFTGDFEAYSRTVKPDGTPQRPEIYEAEHTDEVGFYNFGFKYDLPGTERAIHFPFNRVQGLESEALRCFLRSDRIAQYGVRYFMGMDGYTLEGYLDLIHRFSAQPEGEEEGHVIIFADDAEYIGTNGWFRLKYQNKPDNVFEACPDAREKLIGLISNCLKTGAFATFSEACQSPAPITEELFFDDDSAWHGGRASTWAKTPMAQLLRPWQDLVRKKLTASDLDKDTETQAWLHLTNSYNSDGQWPPTLPDAPHIIHPFNYRYCFENLLRAEQLVGGTDHARLDTNPAEVIESVLGIQQELVLKKAEDRLAHGDAEQQARAKRARALVETTRDTAALRATGVKVLYPAEYTTRAEALVEARRLVDGVLIEKDAEKM